MPSKIEQTVQQEVEALHAFFVGWFSGSLPENAFDSQFLVRLSEDFHLIPPAGELLSLEQLSAGLRAAHGSNPDFRIAIRNVKIRHLSEEHILATYEEWQRNALASEPPDNGRISTVLFNRSEPLQWLHVHETWLPSAVTAAAEFDF